MLPAADFHVHLRQDKMMELVVPTIRPGGVNLAYVMVQRPSNTGESVPRDIPTDPFFTHSQISPLPSPQSPRHSHTARNSKPWSPRFTS